MSSSSQYGAGAGADGMDWDNSPYVPVGTGDENILSPYVPVGTGDEDVLSSRYATGDVIDGGVSSFQYGPGADAAGMDWDDSPYVPVGIGCGAECVLSFQYGPGTVAGGIDCGVSARCTTMDWGVPPCAVPVGTRPGAGTESPYGVSALGPDAVGNCSVGEEESDVDPGA